MADYKRMVSYMYQYENGVKRKNVGYARVETKNGQCKITVHMQLLGQLDSIFPTYLIQRHEDQLELIYLGDTVLKNQVMDSKLTASEDNIMDSGYKLSDMGGLLLFLNDKIFFATEWDDKPIIAEEVLDALKPESANRNKDKDKTDTNEGIIRDMVVKEKENTNVIGEDFQDFTPEKEALIPKYKLPRGWKTIERLQYENAMLTEVTTQKKELEKPPEEREIEEENKNESIVQTDAIETNVDEEAIEKMNRELQNDEPELPDPPEAANFFEKYPRIYPFEDNEIAQCVKIEPKDIGMLPKEVWVLSSNSFLLHGFYCYHHLIFAKIRDRSGCRYILGVPGIYHQREKFMARMFGFESFKSIRKRDLRQGDFGYWYLPLKL